MDSKRRKRETIVVSIRLPRDLVEELDKIVEQYKVYYRSSLIKRAIQFCLKNKCYE